MTGLTVGYKASAEQFGPRDLLDFAVLSEEVGFDLVAVSDHFQPWRHSTGHAPHALTWMGALGERTNRVWIGTSVLTPTFRCPPAMVAQAFGTLGCLYPGRVFLGVGSGEAMNETPALGLEWPAFKERSDRLSEAVTLIKQLWAEERVSFDGVYYQTRRATVYDRPDTPVPIFMAASGPKAARRVGRLGDGFICTSGKDASLYTELLTALQAGAESADRDVGKMSKMIELKVSYDTDIAKAREACRWWAALGLTTEEKSGTDDPIELERLADANPDRGQKRFLVTDDPDDVVSLVEHYANLGFTYPVLHGPGSDQQRFLRLIGADVLPRIRARFGSPAVDQSYA